MKMKGRKRNNKREPIATTTTNQGIHATTVCIINICNIAHDGYIATSPTNGKELPTDSRDVFQTKGSLFEPTSNIDSILL